jgi:hypothetical protein
MAIEVPRSPDIGNKNVTKEIERFLLDKFAAEPEQPWSIKELIAVAKRKFSNKFGDELAPHVSWAVDMLHFNKLIKRVAPGVWESVDGPDEVFTERETGHAPEGEFMNRGFDTRDTSHPRNKADFRHEMSKADLSVKMLKNMGKSREDIHKMLSSGDKPFNAVALKLAFKKYFEGADVTIEE